MNPTNLLDRSASGPPVLRLSLQARDARTSQPSTQQVPLPPKHLAVVVVDIWTQHYCTGATDWPAKMIPAWNEFLDAARALGIQVVFASAGDDLKRWEGKPQRTAVTSIPRHPMPASNGFLAGHSMFGPWSSPCMCKIARLEPGNDQPLLECQRQELKMNQDPRIVVRDQDLFIAAGHYDPPDLPSAVDSWGQPAQQELWNLCRQRGITHLLYIGDAANMCVINREFGMIQMRRLGLQTVIVRDLTNAMTFYGYNPDTKKLDPNITPAVGTAKAVEYIEEKIGPSVEGRQIMEAAMESAKCHARARNNRLPETDHHWKKVQSFIEPLPVPEYPYASEAAYEAFQDIKYGVRIHWGLYTLMHQAGESWMLLSMSHQKRQQYQELYKTFNPSDFSAEAWMKLFEDSGLRMFAFTTKHHEGFSLFDTKTRVRQRVNWTAPGGPAIEDCDLAYSVMETPFHRDIVKELCDAAHRHGIKIDLYFSHPDWYDADFRMYGYHPMMTPEGKDILIPGEFEDVPRYHGGAFQAMGPNHTPQQRQRMIQRHRQQLKELLTHYGKIDMMCLDQWMAGDIWPEMRQTMLELRKIQPDVMFRARGIGSYGDYYTPEGFVPGSKENTNMPWFVINCLGSTFSYDGEAKNYKGAGWIISNLVDTVSKGGNFMVCIGPDEKGKFHPTAIEQLHEAGAWLKVNGEAIYATRPRAGQLWKEGDTVRFTRTKDNKTVYAICLKWPGQALTLSTVKPRAGSGIHMLGADKPLTWRQADKGLVIDFPSALQDEAKRPCRFAWAFKIEADSSGD